MLGVWQGAWELNDVQMVGRTQVRSPSGYGIVVPGHHILEILDMPKPKQSREARRKAEDEKNLPALDSALGDAKAKREFDATLEKMLSTPPDPKRTKRAMPAFRARRAGSGL